jgi:hypothetical protein
MKLHTSLDEDEIRACMNRAQAAGELPADIVFDVFGQAGSRSHPHGFEIHLASARKDTRADSVTRKNNPMAGSHGGPRYAASYDEWGWFLAELFTADPDAKAAPYKNADDFHAKTRWAYAAGTDEMPADEPEPYRAAPDTEPASNATLPVLARIDDVLGAWSNTLHP